MLLYCLHLYVSQFELRGGCLRAENYTHCDCSGYGEGDGGEEAEDVLDTDEGGVHVAGVWVCGRCSVGGEVVIGG